jgi:hypothetical protein
MRKEMQVCSMKQAKLLKELGVSQKSRDYYLKSVTGQWVVHEVNQGFYPEQYSEENYAAFNVAELGEMLPRNFCSYYCGLDMWRIGNCFHYANSVQSDKVGRFFIGEIKTYDHIISSTEAHARAEMLIHLLEHGTITAEDVNRSINLSESISPTSMSETSDK